MKKQLDLIPNAPTVRQAIQAARKQGYDLIKVRQHLRTTNTQLAIQAAMDSMKAWCFRNADTLYDTLKDRDVLLRCCPITRVVKRDNDPFDDRYLVTAVVSMDKPSNTPEPEMLLMTLQFVSADGTAPRMRGLRNEVAKRMALYPDDVFGVMLDIAIAIDYPQ